MEKTQKSPSLTAQMKTRNAVNKLRHGSPKLQEVLRERCRQRMREKRGQLYNYRRRGKCMEADEELYRTLNDFVLHELSELNTSDDVGEDFQNEELVPQEEFLAEQQRWIVEEYEKFEQEELECLARYGEESLRDSVICPICEKGVVVEHQERLICQRCDMHVPRKMSVNCFGKIIKETLEMHSSKCSGKYCIVLIPEDASVSLFLTCETCSIYSIII